MGCTPFDRFALRANGGWTPWRTEEWGRDARIRSTRLISRRHRDAVIDETVWGRAFVGGAAGWDWCSLGLVAALATHCHAADENEAESEEREGGGLGDHQERRRSQS